MEREDAGHERCGAEQRRRAGGGEVEAELHVLDEVARGERRVAEQRPGKRHARAHQLARQAEAAAAERPHAGS